MRKLLWVCDDCGSVEATKVSADPPAGFHEVLLTLPGQPEVAGRQRLLCTRCLHKELEKDCINETRAAVG